jgi:hypothetical protein
MMGSHGEATETDMFAGDRETAARSVADKLKSVTKGMPGDPNRNAMALQRRYAYERLLARMRNTSYADRWVLKGGVLMLAMDAPIHRVTLDADFSARGKSPWSLTAALREIVSATPEREDGMTYVLVTEGKDAPRIIREEADRPTARATLVATLHCTRPVEIRFVVDVTNAEMDREPTMREWPPTVRGFEPLVVPTYSWELVAAEKLHAILTGTEANPRLRDYGDVIALARSGQMDSVLAAEELAAVFTSRGDALPMIEEAVGLSVAFAARRQKDWEGTLSRTGWADAMPASLAEAISELRMVVSALLDTSTAPALQGPGR